jgi:NAD-dependent SIR2 family protein deacetylase
VKVLHDHGLLKRLYTQNIDGLDFQLNLPTEKVVNVHGSLADMSCEFCGCPYPTEEFYYRVRTQIRNIYDDNDTEAPKTSTNILCKSCERPGVKPNTVMYGRSMPQKFFECLSADFPEGVDLVLVAGTSLTVYPACEVVNYPKSGTPRLVINMEKVGQELGLNYDSSGNDAIIEGPCDSGFIFLAKELGWFDDLNAYKSFMCPASAEALEKVK